MCALSRLLLAAAVLLSTGCVFPQRPRTELSQEARGGLDSYTCKKLIRKKADSTQVLLTLGQPTYVSSDCNEFIYHMPLLAQPRVQFAIVGICLSGGGASSGNIDAGKKYYIDYWWRLRFDDEQQLIAARCHRIERQRFHIEREGRKDKNVKGNKKTYKKIDWPEDYYTKHLESFKEENILWSYRASRSKESPWPEDNQHEDNQHKAETQP